MKFTKNTSNQSTLIEQLETESSQLQLEAAIEGGKVIAARYAVEKIQAEMEVICMTIKKRQDAIKKSTSKILYKSQSI